MSKTINFFQLKVQPDELLSEAQFVQWMKMEPLCMVWLPTLHRIAAAETGIIYMTKWLELDSQLARGHDSKTTRLNTSVVSIYNK